MKRKVLKRIMVFMLLAMVSLSGCGRSTEQQIAEQLNLGEKYLEELDYEQAILAFDQVIELDPNRLPAYTGKGQAYIGQQNYEAAVSAYVDGAAIAGNLQDIDLQELENLRQQLRELLNQLALEALDAGDYELANQYYELMMQVGEEVAAILGKAEVLLTQGELEKAEKMIQDGLSEYPEDEGLKEKEKQFQSGEIKDYKGRTIKITWYDADGTMTSYMITEYGEQKSITRHYGGDGILESEEYAYHDDGDGYKYLKREWYSVDGELLYSEEQFNYDDGTLKWITYDAEGTITSYVEGNDNEKRTYDAEGNLKYYDTSEYDEQGREVRWNFYDGDGTLKDYYVSEYDEEGNRTSYIHYNADGTIENYMEEE